MAALKRISGIILCVFAILLMSHNTSALSFGATDIRAYRVDRSCANLTNSELTNYCLSPTIVQGNLDFAIPTNTKSVNSFTLGFTKNTPDKYIMNVAYRYCPRNPDALIGWTGFSSNALNAIVEQDWIINGSCVSGSVSVFGATANNNVKLGAANYGSFTAWDVQAGAYADFNTPTFIILSDDADYSSVLNAIKNNTDDIKTKLDQLEEAAETQQEAAQKELDSVENIENQSADDYEMQSANMSSLFSQFGGFITAVSGAHVGDCNIPANLNHINLGILNLCDNPVPDYAQVAVSIIVCMLIAPYLLNIIKRIIGIADKVREV